MAFVISCMYAFKSKKYLLKITRFRFFLRTILLTFRVIIRPLLFAILLISIFAFRWTIFPAIDYFRDLTFSSSAIFLVFPVFSTTSRPWPQIIWFPPAGITLSNPKMIVGSLSILRSIFWTGQILIGTILSVPILSASRIITASFPFSVAAFPEFTLPVFGLFTRFPQTRSWFKFWVIIFIKF